MTAEVKVEETKVADAEVVVPEESPKQVVADADNEDTKKGGDSEVNGDSTISMPKTVQKSSSYKEESNYLSDLKEFEKKALTELKSKLEEAILGNKLFKKDEPKKKETGESEKKVEEKEKKVDKEETEKEKTEESEKQDQEQEAEKNEESEKQVQDKEAEKNEEPEPVQECEEEKKPEEEKEEEIVDKDISLWGVPLLPSKGAQGTDVVLLKFLRAREFKVNEAFQMLKKTLQWRKESNVDSILEEDLEVDLSSAFYMNGVDREGHPVCYNIYGAFADADLYSKAFGSEQRRKQFLRWRFQLMEKGIQKLDLKPGGVTSLLQINDLKNSPAPSKKDLRVAMNQAVSLLQDNYPEFVARNIFINVPFWYYALNALLSPFLTQRSKSKFVVSRPAKVTETLLKYIPAQEIPVQYGGFKRENDFEFSAGDDEVSELIVKAGSTETIEISTAEVGVTLIWDLTVLGWEVNYKEEFAPNDEGSYTVIIQKAKKMSSSQEPLRNTFTNSELGKVVLTIENTSSKKKRVLYRYKTKKTAAASF
ncbi:patellin-4 [Ricinus communis]|uniref:Patellin-4, putative n=1 Tax=Ricinus communis TaxID=3988 RepID=B9SAY7_RICCO|nr:patellin-4 [Ricinus communis]EEF39178.1 Patellin-4, putative [Ricinus communis]|eukprot:XP_002523147.1 patellin-4 [Ricinus communis]